MFHADREKADPQKLRLQVRPKTRLTVAEMIEQKDTRIRFVVQSKVKQSKSKADHAMMRVQHRRAAATCSAQQQRCLLTKFLFLVTAVAISTTSNLCVTASTTSPSNDTANDECSNDANDKNDGVCASRIVPPSNGDGDSPTDAAGNNDACVDLNADCAERAERGECGGKFAGLMLDECRLSCHVCDDYEYVDVKRTLRNSYIIRSINNSCMYIFLYSPPPFRYHIAPRKHT